MLEEKGEKAKIKRRFLERSMVSGGILRLSNFTLPTEPFGSLVLKFVPLCSGLQFTLKQRWSLLVNNNDKFVNRLRIKLSNLKKSEVLNNRKIAKYDF